MTEIVNKIKNIANKPLKHNLKVGIVGCGFVSQFHISAWRHLGCEVVAYCDINPKAIENTVKLCGPARSYADYKEMFNKENLGAISICTVPFNHAEITAEALKHNIMVGVEKPFTVTAKEAAPFKEDKRIVLVHNQMFESHYYEVYKFLQNKRLGEIYHATTFLGDPVDERMTKDVNGWAYKLPGGRIAESLPHPVYQIQYMLGEDDLKVESVNADPFKDGKPTYRALTAVLSGSNGKRGVLNVRMDAASSIDSLMAMGSLGIIRASLIPAGCTYTLYGEPTMIMTLGKHVESRVILFESLIKGTPLASANHAYHNARIIDDIIAMAQKNYPL